MAAPDVVAVPGEPNLPSAIRAKWPRAYAPGFAPDRPHVFAVVTWGAAATTWLAKALGAHPHIFCVHACNVPLGTYKPAIQLDGVDYAAFVLEAASGYEVAGDVHGFSRYDIETLKATFGTGFSAAVLVREPLRRLASQLAHYAAFDNAAHMDIQYIDSVIEETGLTLPDDEPSTKLFVHAVNMLNSIVDEQPVGPIYKMEDVTRDAAVFRELVRCLSGGRIEPDSEWIATTLSLGRVNEHRRRKEPDLTDWQVRVVRRLVWPRAWEIYEELGYEPSIG